MVTSGKLSTLTIVPHLGRSYGSLYFLGKSAVTETLATKGLGRFASGLLENNFFNALARNQSVIVFGLTAFQVLLLLFALKVNRHLFWLFPKAWLLLPIFLCVTLSRARFRSDEKPILRLWQLIGVLSATYSLLHYPLLAPVNNNWLTTGNYVAVVTFWIGSFFGGMLSFYVPSLAVLPPAFLVWCNYGAEKITGLPVTTDLDIMPLNEVAICIGLGLFISHTTSQALSFLSKGNKSRFLDHLADVSVNTPFSGLVLLMAISIHLANYFWSFVAKISLDGPFLAWLTKNNPANMFLVALDDDHILFSGYPHLVSLFYHFVDAVHIYSNCLILLSQGLAIVAFFLPARAFVLLLLTFDVMHFSIIVLAGLNFWPWIILNLIIASIVVAPSYKPQPIFIRVIATLFILVAPRFVQVANLGWYDTGVNNKLFFEAVDRAGVRYVVPTNFFTFYSYSFGHMDYGTIDPVRTFMVESPNGVTHWYKILQASSSCDAQSLYAESPERSPYQERMDAYLRNYHNMAKKLENALGVFPYDLYPHHFYVPLERSERFRRLDKSSITAYIYRQETVCLSFPGERIERKILGSFERRIDLDADR
jgi:hypothetical protein